MWETKHPKWHCGDRHCGDRLCAASHSILGKLWLLMQEIMKPCEVTPQNSRYWYNYYCLLLLPFTFSKNFFLYNLLGRLFGNFLSRERQNIHSAKTSKIGTVGPDMCNKSFYFRKVVTFDAGNNEVTPQNSRFWYNNYYRHSSSSS